MKTFTCLLLLEDGINLNKPIDSDIFCQTEKIHHKEFIMKIRNAIEIYSLDIPVSNLPISSGPQCAFFSSKKKSETVYFRSSDDVLLYQKNHPALSSLSHVVQLGIEDPKGSNQYILI
jgi:hypothetical protein